MKLSRRDLLRIGGTAALGVLVACAKKDDGTDGVEQGTIDQILGQTSPKVQLIPAGTELLSSTPQRVAFGIIDPTSNVPIPNADVRIWVAKDRQTKAIGPFAAPYHGDGLGDRGVYVTEINFPADATYIALAEVRTSGRATEYGIADIQVAVRNAMPKVGDPAVSVATPTEDAARGVDPICTRKPPCDLHKVSLDEALRDKKPVVVIFATPAFCQSRLCGPEVDIVEAIAKEHQGDAAFIHVEVYRDDDDETVARGIQSPASAAWKLAEEPAIYYIDRSGVIAERQLGPIDRTDVRTAVGKLLA